MRLRMSISHLGVQTMVSYPDNPILFMQPIEHRSKDYVLYNRNTIEPSEFGFECGTVEENKKKLD